jgi:hypothetical protein
MMPSFNIQLLIEAVTQALIALTSLAAIWMVTRDKSWSRWGYMVGLAGQPFWLYSTFAAGQVGMFIVSLLYTWFWMQSIRDEWFSKPGKKT